jgi:cyanate permease
MVAKQKNGKKYAAFVLAQVFVFGLMGFTVWKQAINWPTAFFLSCGMIGACALAIGFVLSEKSLATFMDKIDDALPGHKEKDGE